MSDDGRDWRCTQVTLIHQQAPKPSVIHNLLRPFTVTRFVTIIELAKLNTTHLPCTLLDSLTNLLFLRSNLH
jgi:hypothetical protein